MSYIGQGLPADTFQGFTTDKFTGDGTANKTFTLTKEPFSEDTILVTIDGVVQEPTDDFTVSGTTLTLVGTAANGSEVNVTHMGGPLPIGGASELDLNGASDKLILDADGDTTISADTDDQIDFKAGGTDVMSMTATGLTINDGVEITTADNTDTLTLTSTDADATSGPILKLNRNSASPADSDDIGKILFTGENDASESIDYATIRGDLLDVTDGTEDGIIKVEVITAGTNKEIARFGNGVGVVFNEDSNSDLDFRVESDDNSTMFKVDAGNNAVGVGAVNTGRTFNVTTPSSYSQFVTSFMNESSSAPYGLYIKYDQSPDSGSDYQFLDCVDGTAARFVVYSDGDAKNHDGVFTSISSDERLKSNITDANSQWDDIKAIKFRNFKKKDDIEQYGADNAKTLLGVVAQEAESVTPKLVENRNPFPQEIKLNSVFGTLYEDGDTIPEGKEIGDVKEVKEQVKTFKDSILFWKCAKALQEAMAKIETLETKVKALEDA